MFVQSIILLIAWILSIILNDQTNDAKVNIINRRKYIIIMMTLLALQSGLRNLAVGADTFQYYTNFENAIESSWSELWSNFISFFNGGDEKDPGYALFQKLFAVFLPSFRIYLIVVAAFFFYSLGKIFVRFTQSNKEVLVGISLYMCLYYSFFSITGIRQTIASSFLLLAVPYAMDKKWTKFLLLLLLAASQHKSALLFAPFYILPQLKHSKILLIAALFSFVPMWVVGGKIAKYLVMGSAFEQYAVYLEGYEGAGAYTFAAYIILLAVLILYNYKAIVYREPYIHLLINAISIAVVLTPLTMIDSNNMRIVQYYSVFGLIALPICCTALSEKLRMRNFCIYVFIVLSVYTMSRMETYAFFWQDMSLGDNYEIVRMVNDSILKY